MKKMCLAVLFGLILCLSGCSQQTEQGNNDSEQAVSDIVVTNEKDKLADLYVKNLYDSVISVVADYETRWFHLSEITTLSDLEISDIKTLAYNIDISTHVYDGGSEWARCYDIDDMIATVERVFGPGIEIDTEVWQAGGNVFFYEERLRRFGGEPAYGGDAPVSMIYEYFGKYELDGDLLYVYDKCLFCDYDHETETFKFYLNADRTADSYVGEDKAGKHESRRYSNDEFLAEYGAEYKHTFKLTEDGLNYYWISSEPVR